MTEHAENVLSDAEIAAMNPDQRHDLIMRLQRPLDDVLSRQSVRRMRRIRLTLMTGSTIVLIPWIINLGFTLPANYTAHNWPATWIGFDVLLVAFMATTAVLGWLRRQLVLLTAFTTGVLLVCDAWFDIMTSDFGHDVTVPLVTAVLIELPLALIMITGAVRILRLTATRLWFLEPGAPLWQLPLLP
ncbi:hypothetical protein M2432_005332 [Mycobacterium sp. OTB74]|nr:hypothetical protein [Mycobacterium sp. OTB74]